VHKALAHSQGKERKCGINAAANAAPFTASGPFALSKQTKGLQAEYERLTKSSEKGGATSDEAVALKAQVSVFLSTCLC